MPRFVNFPFWHLKNSTGTKHLVTLGTDFPHKPQVWSTSLRQQHYFQFPKEGKMRSEKKLQAGVTMEILLLRQCLTQCKTDIFDSTVWHESWRQSVPSNRGLVSLTWGSTPCKCKRSTYKGSLHLNSKRRGHPGTRRRADKQLVPDTWKHAHYLHHKYNSMMGQP